MIKRHIADWFIPIELRQLIPNYNPDEMVSGWNTFLEQALDPDEVLRLAICIANGYRVYLLGKKHSGLYTLKNAMNGVSILDGCLDIKYVDSFTEVPEDAECFCFSSEFRNNPTKYEYGIIDWNWEEEDGHEIVRWLYRKRGVALPDTLTGAKLYNNRLKNPFKYFFLDTATPSTVKTKLYNQYSQWSKANNIPIQSRFALYKYVAATKVGIVKTKTINYLL